MMITGNVLAPNSLAGYFGWVTLILVAAYIVTAFRTWYRLRHIPGPRLASFSYLWMVHNTIRGRNDVAYLGLRKYGSLVRNGPNYLVTDDPEVLRKMAAARSTYTRDSWYSAVKWYPDRETMGSILDTAAHDKLKSKTAGGYNGRENPDLEAAVDSQVGRLISLIRRNHLSSGDDLRAVDFSLLSRFFTLDVITRLGYGKPFGYLDNGHDVYGYVSQVDTQVATMSVAMDIPLVRDLLFSPLIFRLIAPKPTDEKGIGRVIGVTKSLIAERFEDGAQPQKDMFGGFIRHGLTQEELESEALLQISAGSDTTASTIRGTLLHILATPHVYQRLKTEITTAIEQKTVSSPIKHAEALKLPYLQAVIWEGYRIRCPVPYGHYKLVPPQGDTINGIFVPGGTAIGHNTLALTRRKDIFGRDVEVFRPERFIECSEVKRLEMDRAIDITFGGGRWVCAGKSVAVMELNKVFFELLRAFDFQLINPTAPWKETTRLVVCHTDMLMRVTEAVL